MTVSLTEKKGYFYAIVSYKDDGKYKQKWISLKLPVKNNKRKAEAMLRDIRSEYEDLCESTHNSEKFTSYIEKWLEKKKSTVELSTWEGYDIYAKKHIIPYFQNLDLSIYEIKPSHIKDYYDYMYTSGRLDGKPGGLSVASIKKHSIVIKEVLNEAVIDGYISHNPATGVKMPAKLKQSSNITFLNSEEANNMLSLFSGHMLQPMIYVTIYYGLRKSEALGLRWSAIDFQNDKISINHTVVKNVSIQAKDSTKSDCSNHTYNLLEDVKDALLKLRDKQTLNKSMFGNSYFESDYVFTWDDGRLIRPDFVTRSFQSVLKKNGFKKMRFHDLRHSTASILYDKGWDMKDIQMWLRHSSIDVTADIYTHISNDRKSRMSSDLNSTFQI